MKRVAIATALGVVAGVICVGLGVLRFGFEVTAVGFGWVLLNRTLIGFVIGISALRLHWALHGSLIGLLVGSLFSYYIGMIGGNAVPAIAALVMSLLFGLAIEFFTSIVFKQPQRPGVYHAA